MFWEAYFLRQTKLSFPKKCVWKTGAYNFFKFSSLFYLNFFPPTDARQTPSLNSGRLRVSAFFPTCLSGHPYKYPTATSWTFKTRICLSLWSALLYVSNRYVYIPLIKRRILNNFSLGFMRDKFLINPHKKLFWQYFLMSDTPLVWCRMLISLDADSFHDNFQFRCVECEWNIIQSMIQVWEIKQL